MDGGCPPRASLARYIGSKVRAFSLYSFSTVILRTYPFDNKTIYISSTDKSLWETSNSIILCLQVQIEGEYPLNVRCS